MKTLTLIFCIWAIYSFIDLYKKKTFNPFYAKNAITYLGSILGYSAIFLLFVLLIIKYLP